VALKELRVYTKESMMKIKIITSILILLLAACSTQPTPSNSGVEGQVFIGPLCPVVQEGQECPDKPYQATLIINNSNGREIVKIQTDADGRFKIPLEPGEYILHPESANVMPFASEQTFTVEADTFTQITVNYDSGIR
jgi:hypothetical protein